MNISLHPPHRVITRLFQAVFVLITAACCALPLSATTIIQPSFSKLVQQADYIVRATVQSVTSEWVFDGPNKHITTKVTLDVSEVIAGTPPQPLVLVMLGGKIGNQELRVDGAPQFKVGDEDILFVHGNGVQLNPLVAMAYGRYPVKHDSATGHTYITRENGAPLYNEQEVVLPMGTASALKVSQPAATPLSPEDFKKQIQISRQKTRGSTQ